MFNKTPKLYKQGYLSKPGNKWRPIRLYDISILLYNLMKHISTAQGDLYDANRTLDEIKRALNKHLLLEPGLIESLYYYSNIQNELKEFQHPENKTFDQFLEETLRLGVFDKTYNTIKWKDGKNNE